MRPEGETKRDQPRSGRGRPFDGVYPEQGRRAQDRPFIMPPSCSDQEGQALTRLYQRAAFCVKQESGFCVFGQGA